MNLIEPSRYLAVGLSIYLGADQPTRDESCYSFDCRTTGLKAYEPLLGIYSSNDAVSKL